MKDKRIDIPFGIGKIPVQMYYPDNFNDKSNLPAIIFLHGLGENANGKGELESKFQNLLKNNNHVGLKNAVDHYGYVLYVAQYCNELANWEPGWGNVNYTDAIVESVLNTNGINKNKVILTGLSMGGGGVWNYIAKHPEGAKKLSAAIPVCGTSITKPNWNLVADAKLPIFVIHAANDTIVTVGNSSGQVGKVIGAGADALYYELGTGGHSIWGWIYDRNFSSKDLVTNRIGVLDYNPKDPNRDKSYKAGEFYDFALSKVNDYFEEDQNNIPEIPEIPTVPEVPEQPEIPKELVTILTKQIEGKLKATLEFSDGSSITY